MPYLQRDPKPDIENGPTVIHPLTLIAYTVFMVGCFAHGTASIIWFLSAFSIVTLDMMLRRPRFVFPRKPKAVDRPHP